MKRYVVTGGAGFIGSALVRLLIRQKESQVSVLDNLFTGHERNLEEVRDCIEFVRGDVRDYEAVVQTLKDADVVFHLAAIPPVPRSIREPVPSRSQY